MRVVDFTNKLRRYAEVLAVRGLNVQPGQFVQIHFEPHAQELAELVGERAYALGAKHVFLSYFSPKLKYAQLAHGPKDDRYYFPAYEKARFDQIVDTEGCFLNLRTNAEPELFDDIAEEAGDWEAARWQIRSRYRDEGINKGKISWSVAYPASPKMAQKVYPECDPETAYVHMWDAVFRMSMCDQPDCIARWQDLDRTLHDRRRKLDELQIRQLRFSGEGTDLFVGLSSEAVWQGGSKQTAAGKLFTANVPSFEVFSVPDRRAAQGSVRMTRPVNIDGVLVEDLQLRFKDGAVVGFECSRGEDAFASLLKKDESAVRLGEVALVGRDSPVAKEGRIFYETLYDENAACHIAIGEGYTSCLRNGWQLTDPELERHGYNRAVHSHVHQDMMISGPGTTVMADTGSRWVTLLEDGYWCKEFL